MLPSHNGHHAAAGGQKEARKKGGTRSKDSYNSTRAKEHYSRLVQAFAHASESELSEEDVKWFHAQAKRLGRGRSSVEREKAWAYVKKKGADSLEAASTLFEHVREAYFERLNCKRRSNEAAVKQSSAKKKQAVSPATVDTRTGTAASLACPAGAEDRNASNAGPTETAGTQDLEASKPAAQRVSSPTNSVASGVWKDLDFNWAAHSSVKLEDRRPCQWIEHRWHFATLTVKYWRPIACKLMDVGEDEYCYDVSLSALKKLREIESKDPSEALSLCNLPHFKIAKEGQGIYGALVEWCRGAGDDKPDAVDALFEAVLANKYNRVTMADKRGCPAPLERNDSCWGVVKEGEVFVNTLAKAVPRDLIIAPPGVHVTLVFGFGRNFDSARIRIRSERLPRDGHIRYGADGIFPPDRGIADKVLADRQLAEKDPLICRTPNALVVCSTTKHVLVGCHTSPCASSSGTEFFKVVADPRGKEKPEVDMEAEYLSPADGVEAGLVIGYNLDFTERVLVNGREVKFDDLLLYRSGGHVAVVPELPKEGVETVVVQTRWHARWPAACTSVPLGADEIINLNKGKTDRITARAEEPNGVGA